MDVEESLIFLRGISRKRKGARRGHKSCLWQGYLLISVIHSRMS